jgi:hypothetical protein
VSLGVATRAERAQVPRLVPSFEDARDDVVNLGGERPAASAAEAVTLQYSQAQPPPRSRGSTAARVLGAGLRLGATRHRADGQRSSRHCQKVDPAGRVIPRGQSRVRVVKWLAMTAGAALFVLAWGHSEPASGRSQSEALRSTLCRPSQLRIANGFQVSAATGQNPLSFVLTNRSAKPCVLDGYPTVALLDAHGNRLPFRVSHSGDQMVTSRPPVAVRVLPRRSAFFVLNKYRCDLGNLKVAKKLRVALPDVRTPARLTVAIPMYPVIGYCGGNDPGSVVTVSPIEPTLGAALAHG